MKARDNQEWDKTNGIFDLTSMKKSSTVLSDSHCVMTWHSWLYCILTTTMIICILQMRNWTPVRVSEFPRITKLENGGKW